MTHIETGFINRITRQPLLKGGKATCQKLIGYFVVTFEFGVIVLSSVMIPHKTRKIKVQRVGKLSECIERRKHKNMIGYTRLLTITVRTGVWIISLKAFTKIQRLYAYIRQ